MRDVGSMAYNMNLIKNTNARGNVLDKFNECKEFVNFETDALIITLTLSYFGLAGTDVPPEEVIPPTVITSSKEAKIGWFYDEVKKMILQFVVEPNSKDIINIHENIAALSNEAPVFFCSEPGCHKTFRYEKVWNHHKKKVHHSTLSELEPIKKPQKQEAGDDIHNYCTARLNLGLLVRNADDAVKEGDGERILNCWKFFLLYFKAFGHHKYAYASFLQQAKVKAILTEAQSEQLVWNRTVNKKGGKGRNISCDIRLEQINCLTKELLHNLGVNLNEGTALRESQAIGFLERILQSVNEDMHISLGTGSHKVKSKEADMQHLVNNLLSKKIFQIINGRRLEKFEGFKRNLLARLDVMSLSSWLSGLLKQTAKKYL